VNSPRRRRDVAGVPSWLERVFGDPEERLLSLADVEGLAARAAAFARGGGETSLGATSSWAGELRWALNRATLASDRRNHELRVARTIDGARGGVVTNQIDDVSIEGAVRAAERTLHYDRTNPERIPDKPPRFDYPKTAIWSDATSGQPADERARGVQAIIAPAEQAGMVSFGFVAVQATGHAIIDPALGDSLYARYTDAQCSLTVRDAKGMGSGWAGASSYDWSRIDPHALAQRALQKCLASRNPVTIEPGRYTVILEPQAVHGLLRYVFAAAAPLTNRGAEHNPRNPFNLRDGMSKLGLQVTDSRLTIVHDPTDPDLGMVPFLDDGQPLRPITYVDHGLLANLSYMRDYALRWLHENLGFPGRLTYRMSGGSSTIDEMISTTPRGLLVTRLSNIDVLDERSTLLTGVTRDGLWLIEHGKISKAVKNLRFTESALAVLNSIEMLGSPEPVFSPREPAIVPPVKARDFSFTATIDAI